MMKVVTDLKDAEASPGNIYIEMINSAVHHITHLYPENQNSVVIFEDESRVYFEGRQIEFDDGDNSPNTARRNLLTLQESIRRDISPLWLEEEIEMIDRVN